MVWRVVCRHVGEIKLQTSLCWKVDPDIQGGRGRSGRRHAEQRHPGQACLKHQSWPPHCLVPCEHCGHCVVSVPGEEVDGRNLTLSCQTPGAADTRLDPLARLGWPPSLFEAALRRLISVSQP